MHVYMHVYMHVHTYMYVHISTHICSVIVLSCSRCIENNEDSPCTT